VSSDTRRDGPDDELVDSEEIELDEPTLFSVADDPSGTEETEVARYPDVGTDPSGQGRIAPPGGLQQMFSSDPTPARHVLPTAKEGDALLDMLFDDARDAGLSPPAEEAHRPSPPPPAAPPPRKAPPKLPDRTPAPRAVFQSKPAATEFEDRYIEEDLATEHDVTARRPPPVAPNDHQEQGSHELEPEEITLEARPVARLSKMIPSQHPPPVAFDHEEDASTLILRTQQRDDWVDRAEWLRAEATALDDKAARASGLLVVSELLSMSGEAARARGVAEEARELVPSMPLAHRQVRGLLAREGDWAGVLEVLDAETRTTSSPAARCHGALLGAEIARVSLGDEEDAKKRVEQALRADPSDPRAYIQRFCEVLATPDAEEGPLPLSKLRISEAPELGPLADAMQQVIAHRGLPSRGPRSAGSIYEALLQVRAAIAAGDHAATVSGLEELLRSEALAGGASWLTSVIAAAHPQTRARSIAALRGLLRGSHADQARRAMVARALELDDAAAVRSATESLDADAFSPADRVALAALSGGSRADVEPWIDALIDDPDLSPLASAATAAASEVSSPDRNIRTVGSARARAAATLGRAMAGASGDLQALSNAVISFADAAPESGIARALSLELDLDEGNGIQVALTLATLRDHDGDRERSLAVAVIAEAAGEYDRAKTEFERVRGMDLTSEAVARAAAAHVGPDAAARILAEHAQALEVGSRASVLLVEAAIRLDEADDPAESEALLRRAAEMDPTLPLSYYLGERAARARGDRDTLVEWIRYRREAAQDPLEQAYDLVREAMLIADREPTSSAALFEHALRARPTDIGLRELFERLSPELLPDRAVWRAERAAETTGPEAARLALEAAFELEWTGDMEGASRAARQAIAAGEELLAPIVAYRAAIAGHGAGDLVDALLPRARESEGALDRLEIYERLAELDERGRGDVGSGLLWRRTILEETPAHLPTLRRLASALISEGRDEDLEPIITEIARTLDGPEAIAHAMLSARLRLRAGTWDTTREPVEIAYRNEPRGIWALRQMAAHARAQGLHPLALEADRQLIERTQRASEAATLSLRAAQSAFKAGQTEDALAFLGHAIELVPTHLVAHLEIAAALEQTDDAAGAAAALESAANASVSPVERANNLYRAALLWHDKVSDVARARQALEAVAELDPSYGEVFQRLQAIYIAEGARAELAALLKRRLDAVADPQERVEMEVLRGRALADVGDAVAAKLALAAALEANPDHVEALAAFGDVATIEEDWSGAEQAWIRLARLVSEPERQSAIYFRLGELYDAHLSNPERAERAYQEILKRAPGDARARERLVALFQRSGDSARALEQQTLLINAAEAPEEKCKRTTELARIYELMGDVKKAEATLLQARKTWPKDDVGLAALARFYQRNSQTPAANVLLDRAVADARRALATGRFEPYLFSTVATIAELRSRPDAARIARAAVAGLEGNEADLEGAGAAAGDVRLDDFLAPDVMTPAFRDLLRLTGPLLDTAVPFDLSAVRATPLPPHNEDVAELIQMVAASYGLPGTQVFISGALGAVCVPVSAHPPALVLGHSLLVSPREDVRGFLIHRALKVIQANAAAISRTAPIDLWPLIAAYLKVFNQGWAPQGADAAKLSDFYGRLTRAMPHGIDPQVGILAADVIGSIGNRASTLNTVVNGWGNRTGLLAVGDLNVAIAGIAWAGGNTNAPPASGKDRMTWIGRNAEARELIVFSVSDSYADARGRLGLTGE
jgi:tetratricopeptide (TPR) repeat protein